jgi:hypothetical protein
MARKLDVSSPAGYVANLLQGLSNESSREVILTTMESAKPNHQLHLTPSGTEDERRWERQSVVIPVNITVFLEGERHSFRGQASDISRGGMSLFLTRELPFGTSVTLELLIPYNRTEFVVRGVVRNRDGFTHGVEFLNPSPQQQQMIERTCKIFKLLS